MLGYSRTLTALVLCTALVGCASDYAQRGTELYAGGRYIEAAEIFEHAEPKLGGSSPEQQAEYGLYRGATLLALKDYEHARRWLAYSYQVEQAYPGSLGDEQRSFLHKAWATLSEGLRNTPPGAPQQAGTAIASSSTPLDPNSSSAQKPELVPARRSFMGQ